MSMNIYCNVVELPQIGTWDSYMIYSNMDGKASGVTYRLEQYFRREHQNNFNRAKTPLDRNIENERLEYCLGLVKEIRQEIAKHPRKVKFWVW